MDPLEPMLETMKAEAWVYCLVRGHDSWSIRIPASDTTVFHAVRSGRCSIVVGEDDEVELRSGDFVVIPHGEAHLVAAGSPAREVGLFKAIQARADPELSILDLGDGHKVAHTELVCGGFRLARAGINPLEGLPRLILLRHSPSLPELDPLLDLAVRELSQPRLGSQTVLSSIGRLLLVETLRNVTQQLPERQPALLAAIGDSRISAVISAIHHHPEQTWDIARLADLAVTSRSTLTELFRRRTGTTIGEYLHRWRMAVATALLEDTEHDLSHIAAATGYGSEAAFSRAFKRRTGSPPIAYRRHSRSLESSQPPPMPPLIQAAIAEYQTSQTP